MVFLSISRRRVARATGRVAVVAAVIAVVGCTSTTDESGASVDDVDQLEAESYPDAMNDICQATTTRLETLPAPPEEISRVDWANEVALALSEEAEAFDEIDVVTELGSDHRSFIANTEQQADQWVAVGAALADASGSGTDSIGDLTAEIGQLTLGRDDLAGEMGLDDCGSRGIGQ